MLFFSAVVEPLVTVHSPDSAVRPHRLLQHQGQPWGHLVMETNRRNTGNNFILTPTVTLSRKDTASYRDYRRSVCL
jgi:hypothetical protein